MNEMFAKWLNEELAERGWSQSEAARRGGFSASMMQQVISGIANPGLSFCAGVAKAFGEPLENVFRKAGILPEVGELLPETIEWNSRLKNLEDGDRERAAELIDNVLRLAEGKVSYQTRRDR